jgi:hypothetical protein
MVSMARTSPTTAAMRDGPAKSAFVMTTAMPVCKDSWRF